MSDDVILSPSKRGGTLRTRALEGDLEAAVGTWLHSLSTHTRRLYETSLERLARYMHAVDDPLIPDASIDAAGAYLLRHGPGIANTIVQSWIESMASIDPDTGLPRYTTSTIRGRLSAVRWAIKQARRRGRIVWALDVEVPAPRKDPKSGRLLRKPGRDMRGPSLEEVRQLVDAARSRSDEGLAVCLVSLAVFEVLRSHEIRQLDVEDVDLRARTVSVVRKKREGPEQVPICKHTAKALRRWLRFRGKSRGPLFWGGEGHIVYRRRLSESGVAYILRELGERCGVLRSSPHRLRHTAITLGQAVREELGIPIQHAMRRAGHRSLQAHERYLDVDPKEVRRLTDAVAQYVGC